MHVGNARGPAIVLRDRFGQRGVEQRAGLRTVLRERGRVVAFDERCDRSQIGCIRGVTEVWDPVVSCVLADGAGVVVFVGIGVGFDGGRGDARRCAGASGGGMGGRVSGVRVLARVSARAGVNSEQRNR